MPTSTSQTIAGDTASTDERWHVVHTKPRQEKALARTMIAGELDFYLPLVEKVRFYGHRRRKVELPLFSGYLFLWGNVESTFFVLNSKRAVRIIPVTDQQRFEHEIAQIRKALTGSAELDPYPFLTKGRHVRVTAGPFKGLEGIVDERHKQNRLVLVVQIIGRATSLEIDASLLEAID